MRSSEIKLVCEAELPALDAMLQQLAKDLADPYQATHETLHEALFGSKKLCFALIAWHAGEAVGFVFCAPQYSTSRGASGVYIQDLWVSPKMRSLGLGKELVDAAFQEGAKTWGARYVKLTVYDDNLRAMKFYKDLGFYAAMRDTTLILEKS